MEQYFRSVMSGQASGAFASFLRGVTRLIEPIYRSIVNSRNASYSRGAKPIARAGKPVISVGNITTGGTGKTPVVAWLARQLLARDRRVAVLLRGYKSSANLGSDEAQLLRNLLHDEIVVQVNPDRAVAAAQVLREHPKTDVFILDDGFQHRKLHRDFDLVLIDATNPFGYDHVLPRGLLREPLRSLSRASAILLTRVDQALPDELGEIEACIRLFAPHLPIYRSNHAHRRLIGDREHPVEELADKRVLVFGGIGNPEAFAKQLAHRCQIVAHRWFGDHHNYTRADLAELQSAAANAKADWMITTEKDWVKIAPIAGELDRSIPILRVQMEIEFAPGDERKLFDQIFSVVATGVETGAEAG